MSAGWYGVVFGLFGTAIAIALTGFNQSNETVTGMQRRLMPGKHEIALAAGRTTLYFEERSEIDGRVIEAPPSLELHCTMTDEAGRQARIETPASDLRYEVERYRGHSALDVQINAPGTYALACQGPTPFVLALGGGIGAWRVVAIVGGIVPAIAGLLLAALVTIKRRRWHAKQRS
jgi:hypothetical protein